MTLARDQAAVEAVVAERPHPALGLRVRVRRLHRRVDDLDRFAAEDVVEAAAELWSRSWLRKRSGCCRSSSAINRLRACWVTQAASGVLVEATSSMRRRSSEMKKRMWIRFSQSVSTVRKSQAMVTAACWRRNWRQLSRSRCGAGGRPAAARIARSEVAETAMPRPRNSPTIRWYPQVGFSRASRSTSSRVCCASGGRPGRVCRYLQRRATSRACQRSSVRGLTLKTVQALRGSERLSAASRTRSTGRYCG